MDSQKSTPDSGEAKAPRRARGHARVASLLEAASAEFADKGYDATTMTAIAARAESSIGSLYQFFPTKEHVALALMERYVEQLRGAFDKLRADAPTLELDAIACRLIGMFVTFRQSHPAYVALVDANDGALPGSLDIRQKLRADIASVLSVLAPRLPAGELEVRAAVIQHLMKAAVALSADASIHDRNRATEELQRLVQHYLGDLNAANATDGNKPGSRRRRGAG